MIEPQARKYNNVPQGKGNRVNCENEGLGAHFLTTQGSMNSLQWRIKRPSKVGKCIIRVSVDGNNYHPIRPEGVNSHEFPCGRQYGYESGNFKFPKSLISEDGTAIL